MSRATENYTEGNLMSRAVSDELANDPVYGPMSYDPMLEPQLVVNSEFYAPLDEGAEISKPGLRSTNWLNQDSGTQSSGLSSSAERIAGMALMYANYEAMKAENTIGNDKYFHCKAHCEATALGEGGRQMSEFIGAAREATDLVRNSLPESAYGKGMTVQESVQDIADDLRANAYGRYAAENGLRCDTACYGRFPYKRGK